MWKQQFPSIKPLKIERNLDSKVAKRTKNREYFEFLVKWKGHPFIDATWMTEQELQLQRFDLANIQNSSFVP